MQLKKDINKSYGVSKEEDGWYWYNSQGIPNGPIADEEFANKLLDGYCDDWYRED